ncbi:putative glycosidase CRH2 [Coemansia sp. RSA 2049]|nr:putative glycosidase CRH2 [Coemansia sp. RSA 2049]
MTSAASPDNGAATNTQVQASTTGAAQTTESPQSTTASTSTTSSSSSETTSSSSSPTPDAQSGQIVLGTYSQEPTGRQYTCNSDFVDFSKSDAMSKFSFVWCPENAYQTSNSVVWKLTGSCGTTMVYPWDFYYGRIEARIRIGSGSGVVTAMLLLGPAPSDEIDFEWVGKDTTHVQTMYYVQSHRVDNLPEVFGAAQNNGDLSTTFQDYAIELNKDSVKWYLNGILLRTLDKGAQEFPSDASRARMGIWDGTQTSGWAGTVDWSQGPFTAEMQWFNFTPYC